MTVHIVHYIAERDSDTGHSTYFSSQVDSVWTDEEKAKARAKAITGWGRYASVATREIQ